MPATERLCWALIVVILSVTTSLGWTAYYAEQMGRTQDRVADAIRQAREQAQRPPHEAAPRPEKPRAERFRE
jgi:hypothetical protein